MPQPHWKMPFFEQAPEKPSICIDYLKRTAGSDLNNAGVDVGLPFDGNAPDLGHWN
ncbi:MAG: hypothetical protein JXR76_11005 [Deltaproteobacteria bacterium]|nr:hypothetical protein [Deltaproteobacteria bacterium]